MLYVVGFKLKVAGCMLVYEQFYNIDPHDLYAILNFLDCDRRLKIREGKKNHVWKEN